MERICGFIVVRKPEHAQNEVLKPNLRVGEKVYRGVDRLRWEDLDAAYYDQGLPPSLLPIWQELDQDTVDLSGLKLLKDYQRAEDVLRFSGGKSEMIAIWSAELEEIKGGLLCDAGLNYWGVDCFAMGEWSILSSGVYARPECFPEAVAQLNQHGLLSSEAECNAAFDRYIELAASGVVEPLMQGARATNVRVFGGATMGMARGP